MCVCACGLVTTLCSYLDEMLEKCSILDEDGTNSNNIVKFIQMSSEAEFVELWLFKSHRKRSYRALDLTGRQSFMVSAHQIINSEGVLQPCTIYLIILKVM